MGEKPAHPVYMALVPVRKRVVGMIGGAIGVVGGIFGGVLQWPFWPLLVPAGLLIITVATIPWAWEQVHTRTNAGVEAVAASSSPSVRFVGFGGIAYKAVGDKQQMRFVINFANDGPDATVATFFSMNRFTPPPDHDTLLFQIRLLQKNALEASERGGVPAFPIGPRQEQHTYADGYLLSPNEVEALRRGETTYVLAGIIVAKSIGGEKQIPICGYTVDGEISMCPVEQ